MRILLDCDGIVSDWMSAVNDVIEAGTGRRVTPKEVNGWLSLTKLGFSGTERDYIENVLATRGFCAGLGVYPDAVAGVNALRKLGAEIAYVTSIWWGSETWTYERRAWLKKHGLLDEATKLVFTKDKELVSGDVFVDDRPDNVLRWRKEQPGKLALLWRTEWNAEGPDIAHQTGEKPLQVVNGWAELLQEVQKICLRTSQR